MCIFLYRLTSDAVSFEELRDRITRLTADRRLQLLLVAFASARSSRALRVRHPVAVTGGILIALGFTPLAASGSR